MKRPIISVIVPCYNYAQYIVQCLESIYNQTFTDFECIIVNDGSKDNTASVVLNWIKKDDRFKYVLQTHKGVSSARNHGVSISLGQYILPLDADDMISVNYLEECLKVIESDQRIILVYGESYLLNNAKKKWNLDSFNFEDLLYKNLIHCAGMYRRNDWEIIGGYDEKMTEGLEDWEFWISLLKNGGKVKKIKTVRFYYRIKTSSLNQSVIANHYGYQTRLYIFNKHIELYRKTNFYDMYFENYQLKKKLQKPLLYLNFEDLVILIFQAFYQKIKLLSKKIIKTFIKTFDFQKIHQ